MNLHNTEQVNYWDFIIKNNSGKFQFMELLNGIRFHKLLIVSNISLRKNKRTYVFTVCDCGSPIRLVRLDGVKSGHCKGCTCLKLEHSIKVGKSRRKYKNKNKKLYNVFTNMINRCYSNLHHGYSYYGGRGIEICKQWRYDFDAFAVWAENNGWSENLEIDRIDVNSNYCPENCRFITRKQNSYNKRGEKNSTSVYKGVSWNKERNKWCARIGGKGYIGLFENEIDAAIEYNKAAKELFGEYAWLNPIPREVDMEMG